MLLVVPSRRLLPRLSRRTHLRSRLRFPERGLSLLPSSFLLYLKTARLLPVVRDADFAEQGEIRDLWRILGVLKILTE
jgi:hypothetical protein